jgi:predicted phosphoadenosine phosphosulfate sulfurtransferase
VIDRQWNKAGTNELLREERVNPLKLDIDVFDAAILRLEWVFDTFAGVCLSFSGGKDSTVLFHLAAAVARQKRKKFSVLFVDWEAQYSLTVQHIQVMKSTYQDVISHFYWVALPLTTVSGVSQYQPEWTAWQPGVEWVRQPPEDAITDPAFFPFYEDAMTFESFIPEFITWLAAGRSLASLIGIRTDESLHRYMALTSKKKLRYATDKPWTTASPEGFSYTCYPLYDWKTRDIWIFNAKSKLPYNPLYDLMYRAGVPLRNMRVCEPFGPEQRRGLWLYHTLEPETWEKMCRRVCGAHSGAIYANQSGGYFALNTKIQKPAHLTWRSYAMFLLDSMPASTAEHYRNKIAIYLSWYKVRDYPEDIPDTQENDLGYRDVPSWRRICKTILKNDFWCRLLSFSPTKSKHYEKYCQLIRKKREEWKIMQ